MPLTPGGLAAFAHARFGRLTTVVALTGLLWGLVGVRSVYVAWWPAIGTAVAHLPPDAAIRHGALSWPTDQIEVLVATSFLAITINPSGQRIAPQSADFQIELGRRSIRASSLLGYLDTLYPVGLDLSLRRDDVAPFWESLQPHILVVLWLSCGIALPLLWFALGALIAFPLNLWTSFLKRDVNLGHCWRMAVAGFVPGAVLMAAAVILYAARRVGIAEFLLLTALHLPLVGGYLTVGALYLPKRGALSPFADPAAPPAEAEPENPFASGKG